MDPVQIFVVGRFRVILMRNHMGQDCYWIPGVGVFPSLSVAIGVAMSLAVAHGEVLTPEQMRDLDWFLCRARSRGVEEDLIDAYGYGIRVGENTGLPSIDFCAPLEVISALVNCLRRCEREKLSAQDDAFVDQFLEAVKQDNDRWAASQAVVPVPIADSAEVTPDIRGPRR